MVARSTGNLVVRIYVTDDNLYELSAIHGTCVSASMYPLYNAPGTEDVVLALLRVGDVRRKARVAVEGVGADDAFCVFDIGAGEIVRDEMGLSRV
jgi:hypothetical protein